MKMFDGISYSGVLEHTDFETVKHNEIFKQILIDEIFDLPAEKKDMESILTVSIQAEIIKSKLVKTPISNKIIVHGEIKIIITYTANIPEQSVHSAHFAAPFSTFVNCQNLANCDYLNKCNQIQVNSYVEDSEVSMIDKRRISSTTLVLIAIQNCCKQLCSSPQTLKE